MPNTVITHVTYNKVLNFHHIIASKTMATMPIPPSRAPDSSDKPPMATPQALKAAKKELRTLMKAKLSQIPRSALESQSTSYAITPPSLQFLT
jgi:hypothetical protein